MTDSLIQPLPVAVAVVERDGQYLIGQRSRDVAQGGLWEFPGGKIQPGETASDAAVRECAEETGLQVESTGCLEIVQHQYAASPGQLPGESYWVKISFVACRLSGGLTAAQAPFRWVAVRELGNYEFPAANASLIRRILLQAEEIASR